MLRFMLIFAVVAVSPGCISRLSVKKVSDSPCDDNVKGFRYCLSRPFVIVQVAILVSEETRIITKPKCAGTQPPIFTTELRSGRSREVTSDELSALKRKFGAGEQIKQVAGQSENDRIRQSALDAGNISTADALDIPSTTPAKLTDKDSVQGKIRIVYLPDPDEQYAIHDKSCLCKGAYKLNFRNGWELTDVSSEHDATAVALELLTTIQTAIGAAKSVETAQIDRQKAIAEAYAKEQEKKDANANKDGMGKDLYQVTVRRYIKPGVYRINKPWEIEGGLQAHAGCDLLSSLGLTLHEIVETQTLPAISQPITPLGKMKGGEIGR